MSEDKYIPEWITAKFSVIYDTDHIIEALKDAGNGEPTLDDIVQYIDECLEEDFSSDQQKYVELWDSDGNEL